MPLKHVERISGYRSELIVFLVNPFVNGPQAHETFECTLMPRVGISACNNPGERMPVGRCRVLSICEALGFGWGGGSPLAKS